MATTQLGTEKVKTLTKFGFQNDSGEYINYSKNLKDGDKVNVVPGRTLQVELYIADSGKKYVNKVINAVETADVPAVVKSVKTPKVVTLTGMSHTPIDSPMTRNDWDAKDRRISRQGAIQAAIQAVASYVTKDNHFDVAKELALSMLDFVNETQLSNDPDYFGANKK